MMSVSRFLLVTSAVLVGSAAALGQANDQEESTYLLIDEQKGKAIEFAYGAPSSPALAIAGLKSTDVTKVNEVRKFVASVPSALDGDGSTALALDIRPGLFLTDEPFDYTQDPFYQKWVRRTSVGMAVKEGTNNESDPKKSTRSLLSLGLSTSLLNGADPLHVLFDDKQEGVRDACALAYAERSVSFIEAEMKNTETGERVQTLIRRADRSSSYIERSGYNYPLDAEKLLGAYNNLLEARVLMTESLNDNATLEPTRIEGLASSLVEMPTSDADLKSYAADLAKEVEVLNDEFSKDKYKTPLRGLDTASRDQEYRRLQAASTACSNAINKVVKFAPNLDIGLGALWRGRGSQLSDFESGGGAVWLSYRRPLVLGSVTGDGPQSYWVAGLSGRLGWDELASTGDETLKEAKADTVQVWGGVEYVSSNWRGNARYGYVETDFNSSTASPFSSDGERWLVGADLRMGKGSKFWLSIEYGEAEGTIDALQGEILKIGIKFNDPAILNVFESPN